ncbi:MAG: hypothetical protein QM781_15085 [Chitinophagaceae bacterium]
MYIGSLVETLISKIVLEQGDLEDSELILFLINNDNSKEASIYVTLFTPIVLGRIICEPLNVEFVNVYHEQLEDGTERKGFLTENSFYTEIYKIVKTLIKNGFIDEDSVFKIALRSPEFRLLNDFILKGNNV